MSTNSAYLCTQQVRVCVCDTHKHTPSAMPVCVCLSLSSSLCACTWRRPERVLFFCHSIDFFFPFLQKDWRHPGDTEMPIFCWHIGLFCRYIWLICKKSMTHTFSSQRVHLYILVIYIYIGNPFDLRESVSDFFLQMSPIYLQKRPMYMYICI